MWTLNEVFAHDVLWVMISHKTNERFVFHNPTPEKLQRFVDEHNPIFMGYNVKGYDKYIFKGCLLGYSPEEVREISDYIVEGNNPWEYPYVGYCDVGYWWDLFDCIKTYKSLKELEGNMRMDITETTIPFDLPTKWNKKQYEEVLYYCTADVKALIPLFKKLLNNYKSKYIICKLGNIEPVMGLSMTDANLTATLLGAEKHEYDDPFDYKYPSVVDKNKIPKEVLDYIDDLVEHNDLNYKREAPCLDLGTILFQWGVGGNHSFVKNGKVIYDGELNFLCK